MRSTTIYLLRCRRRHHALLLMAVKKEDGPIISGFVSTNKQTQLVGDYRCKIDFRKQRICGTYPPWTSTAKGLKTSLWISRKNKQ